MNEELTFTERGLLKTHMQCLQKEWQVEVMGQIYEADFEELKQWIAEGAVMPTDKVRRGKLRWISVEKVPALQEFLVSDVSVPIKAAGGTIEQYLASEPSNEDVDWGLYLEKVCHLHRERDYAYACDVCKHYFCKSCPKTYGTVRICPLCDALCRSVDEPLNINKSVGAVNKPYMRAEKSDKKRNRLRLQNFSEMFDYSVKYVKSTIEEGKHLLLSHPEKK